MNHRLARHMHGRANPQGHRKRVGPRKVTNPRHGNAVFATQEQRLTETSLDRLGTLEGLRPMRSHRAWKGIGNHSVEGEPSHGPGDFRRLGHPLGLPVGKGGTGRLSQLLQAPFPGLNPGIQVFELGLLVRGAQQQCRYRHDVAEIHALTRLIDVLEKREELVKFLLRNGVVLVVMASGTLEGHSQKGGPEGVHPIHVIGHAILLFDDTAFFILQVESIERGGQALLLSGVGQKIPRHLPLHESIKGQMPVESPDHPIPPGPDRPVAIRLESVGVSKPGQVEPVGGHSFSIARGAHEALGLLKVVRIRRSAFEGDNLLGSRGQTG